MRKILVILLLFTLLFTVACKDQPTDTGVSSAVATPVVSTPAPATSATPTPDPGPTLYQNPLTGVKELEESQRNLRPVAIMINNISVAQRVQCGLNQADMIYECLVEGGISRLMAVYYNIEAAGQIGSIRSARYTYVQLARGLGAAYVHCGQDNVYTKPYMKELGMDNFNLITHSAAGFREENGLAYEHRLFTNGQLLAQELAKEEIPLTKEEITPNAFSFATTPQTFGAVCNQVSYTMSSSYKTTFVYNPQTKKYTRCPMGEVHKDNKTQEETVTDNLFILYAKSPMFDDNYHLRTILSQGEGIYVSQGTYTPITWEKGEADDPLRFYNQDGTQLLVNPGKSWIAFPPTSNQSKTEIQ